jgi:hypothetical protein
MHFYQKNYRLTLGWNPLSQFRLRQGLQRSQLHEASFFNINLWYWYCFRFYWVVVDFSFCQTRQLTQKNDQSLGRDWMGGI